MAVDKVTRLVDETKALIAEVEAGDTERAAWIAIQDRVVELAEDRTQSEVAELIGKDRRWVQNVLKWDCDRDPHRPHAGPSIDAARQRYQVKKAVTDSPEEVAKAIAAAPPAARKTVITIIAEGDTTQEEVLAAAVDAIDERGKRGRKSPNKLKRKGSVEAWGDLVGWGGQSEHRARLALESIRSVDEPMPDDLARDALRAAEQAIIAWELVAATLRGESVGDQAEAFLAEQ